MHWTISGYIRSPIQIPKNDYVQLSVKSIKQMIHNLPLLYNPALREVAQWKLRRLWPDRCSVPPPASSRRSRWNTPLNTTLNIKNYCNSMCCAPSLSLLQDSTVSRFPLQPPTFAQWK